MKKVQLREIDTELYNKLTSHEKMVCTKYRNLGFTVYRTDLKELKEQWAFTDFYVKKADIEFFVEAKVTSTTERQIEVFRKITDDLYDLSNNIVFEIGCRVINKENKLVRTIPLDEFNALVR